MSDESETFLIKPSQIEALVIIMTLSISIYSLMEFQVRKVFKEWNEAVPNLE